jgi:MFS-type transporter involved in bile tolerance (Atg22 family)
MSTAVSPALPEVRRSPLALSTLFGALYFVQGIGEPTEGLVAQPVRSLLRSWGDDAAQISAFMAILSLPWMIKPVYGLLSDFVPLAGQRRRSWLLLWTATSALCLLLAWLVPPGHGDRLWLLGLLLVPTVGIAFCDVVIDALMVETGQPLGLCGRLQSVQWACLYGASIGTGTVGGWLSVTGHQALGFALCAAALAFSFGLAWSLVQEPALPARGSLREAVGSLWSAAKHPGVAAVTVFLFLWSFNPFSTSVQYVHATESLGLSELEYGETLSIQSAAALAAAIAYGVLARRMSLSTVVHGGIATGILATLAWWGMRGPVSAQGVAVLYGAAYMVGSLMVLDIAARCCPPALAATVFSLLMASTNVAVSFSEALGGSIYTAIGSQYGTQVAYDVLVAVGALCTAGCWLLVPWLRRAAARAGQT